MNASRGHDVERAQLRDRILAERGRFPPWQEQLLELAPATLERLHELVIAAEAGGAVPPKLRHLIWVAVDAVAPHLYPRGIAIHARAALQEGASAVEVVETLEIACVLTSRTAQEGVRILDTIFSDTGADAGADMRQYTRVLRAFVRPPDPHALDPKARALIAFAVHACPAVLDTAGMEEHARAAVATGACAAELREALRLASCIGTHALSVGIPELARELAAFPDQHLETP